jgi:hypothetical protein
VGGEEKSDLIKKRLYKIENSRYLRPDSRLPGQLGVNEEAVEFGEKVQIRLDKKQN